MNPLRTLVVDDEPLARERLERLLKECGCEVVDVLGDGPSLLAWLACHPPVDAMFVDIQMPGPNGLEVLAEIEEPPPVVFVTAYQEYAIQAFEVEAVDYLLKPVFEERLRKTIQRIHTHQVGRLSEAQLKALRRIGIRAGTGQVFLKIENVTHFVLEGEKVAAYRGAQSFPTFWRSLSEVEKAFPDAVLLRIQRNILLRPQAVVGMRDRFARHLLVRVADGVELEVSRAASRELKALLGIAT